MPETPSEGGVIATSTEQQSAWSERRRPPAERVREGVWAIGSPTLTGGLPYTLTYALESPSGDVHIIDPGWVGIEAETALAESLADIGLSIDDVRTVIVTHAHPDHLGLAARLCERTGAELVLSHAEHRMMDHVRALHDATARMVEERWEAWGVPADRRAELRPTVTGGAFDGTVQPDRLVQHGDLLELDGSTLEVVHTPGHTHGHMCLIDRERELVYSGDHVLPEIFSGIGLGSLPDSDPLSDYFSSLEALEAYYSWEVLPGHEYRFRGLGERCRQLAVHHLRRTQEVADLITVLGDAPLWEYAERITWSAGWENLHGFLLQSALEQTALHHRFVTSGSAEAWLRKYRP